MAVLHLRLYVTGATPSATRAISALDDLARGYDAGTLKIEVIDVLEDPAAALNDDVYATPTVFRISPAPIKRLFGDLSHKEALIEGLGLRAD